MAHLGNTISGAAMIVILGAGALMSLTVLSKPELRALITRPLPGYDYLDGSITHTVEGRYKDDLPIKSPAINVLNAVTLVLFGEGRKGVVVGERGWLFTAEEYEWTPDSPQNLSANLRHIADVAAELKRRGVALEIALVPEKADIYADLLNQPRPIDHTGEYESVRARLAATTGAAVPDLRAAMLQARESEDVFFPTDTHWTVAGAGVAARAAATAFPSDTEIPLTKFVLESQPETPHVGDLVTFIELGPFAPLLPATTSGVTPLVAVAQGGSVNDFLGDSEPAPPEVALVGTSYSAIPIWSFEAQLRAALGRDVVNFSEEGKGPLVPMDAFLQKLESGEVSAKAVIWEMPLRYLDDPPPAAGGRKSSA